MRQEAPIPSWRAAFLGTELNSFGPGAPGHNEGPTSPTPSPMQGPQASGTWTPPSRASLPLPSLAPGGASGSNLRVAFSHYLKKIKTTFWRNVEPVCAWGGDVGREDTWSQCYRGHRSRGPHRADGTPKLPAAPRPMQQRGLLCFSASLLESGGCQAQLRLQPHPIHHSRSHEESARVGSHISTFLTRWPAGVARSCPRARAGGWGLRNDLLTPTLDMTQMTSQITAACA